MRYFNPAGAHSSGLLGEDPLNSISLFPCISKVALGKQDMLCIHGDDHPTRDGTAIRDYVHITDIAKGHLMILRKLVDTQGMLTRIIQLEEVTSRKRFL